VFAPQGPAASYGVLGKPEARLPNGFAANAVEPDMLAARSHCAVASDGYAANFGVAIRVSIP